MRAGFTVEDVFPSPKFHVKAGDPVVVLENCTVVFPQPEVVLGVKATTGDGFTLTVISVSSVQLPLTTNNCTEYVPGEA